MSGFGFARAEYDARIARVRAAMETRGLGLLFLADPANMAWLTGYDGWSFYVHQGVLLALDGDPVWWGRGQDANGARLTVFIETAAAGVRRRRSSGPRPEDRSRPRPGSTGPA